VNRLPCVFVDVGMYMHVSIAGSTFAMTEVLPRDMQERVERVRIAVEEKR